MLFGASTEIRADVDIDGEALTVLMDPPNGPEACLWAFLDDWSHLLPGALPEGQKAYWEGRLADPGDPLDRGMLRSVAFTLARQIYGVPWWAAHRITESATEGYLGYQAWCVKHGFAPKGESADRIIASIVAWKSSSWADEAQARAWHQETFMAPPGVRQ